MAGSLGFTFLQCWVGAVALIALLLWRQTAYMGITCLFAFAVSSASLSAFFFGRLCGLSEAWITPFHEQVFIYSGWMCWAMVAAMWLAWWPSKRKKTRAKERLGDGPMFPWITRQFVFFALGLGTVSTIALPFVSGVPTVGTAMTLLASWLKIGLIAAVILFKKSGKLQPLLIAIAMYVPAAFIYALRSGYAPLSLDAIIPIALVATCLNRVTLLSFAKLFVWMVPCVYLMFSWLASRNVIRSGELEQYSMQERARRFADVFVNNLIGLEVSRYDIQYLLFERIDMSDILAQEAGFETSASGEDEGYEYGGTLVDGLYSIVPRALWADKPTVAGYATFVSKFTGTSRDAADDTSIGVPAQFELYANGGPVAVCIGIFALFWLCARLERFVANCDRSLHILMPSVMLLMAFNNGVEQIMLTLATALAGALAAYFVAKVIEVFFPQFLPEFRIADMRRRLKLPAAATA
ncbi:MAG TPA: hypothetical protein VGJ04_05720 [Pirellulales bacterium]|jgi:hypothetical protein